MIKAITSKTANFIFHMLSIGKCGYDNDYGSNSRKLHNSDDILCLSKLSNYITVKGGEYCGELYGICVCIPASFDDCTDMLEYFNAMIDLFENGATSNNFNKYLHVYQKSFGTMGLRIDEQSLYDFYLSCLSVKEYILKILNIYLSNYELYSREVWKETCKELSIVCDKLNEISVEKDYITLWEKELDTKFKHGDFYVVLCNSIENGAQAIDISYNKDVFFPPGNTHEFFKFVSHEFGIYLLKELLSVTNTFNDFSLYKNIESVAEFYNRKICGGYSQFDWYEEFIQKYSDIYYNNPNLSVKDLFQIFVSD